MKYYKHHIGDYKSATAHLSNEEDICYRRLLDWYYDTEQPLEDDVRLLARQCRVSQETVREVLGDFFTLIDGRWHNARANAELVGWYESSEKAKKKADARWEKERKHRDALAISRQNDAAASVLDAAALLGQCSGNAAQMLPTTHYPLPINSSGTNVPDSARPDGQAPATSRQLPCPHKKILALWAEVLPALPQHSVWNATRADHLQARWREVAVEKKWTTEEQGLAFFRKMFIYVGKSPFLTGQTKAKDRPFIIELEWLIKPNNWAKVIEGKYHQQQEA
jgi:uncharacterized protein YdaU (DUF1376 family)